MQGHFARKLTQGGAVKHPSHDVDTSDGLNVSHSYDFCMLRSMSGLVASPSAEHMLLSNLILYDKINETMLGNVTEGTRLNAASQRAFV